MKLLLGKLGNCCDMFNKIYNLVYLLEKIMKLSKKEQKEEIKRLEERSLFYLKFFPAFWFAIIFFIIREIDNNKIAEEIASNFLKSFVNLTTFSNFLTLIILYVLLLAIPLIIAFLSNINVKGILSCENNKKPYNQLLNEKYNKLTMSVMWGYLTSFLLILYLLYLFFISKAEFIKKVDIIGDYIVFLIITLILLINPSISFFYNIKKWNKKEILFRITEILSFLIYTFYILIILIKIPLILNEILGMIMLLLFFVLYPIMCYRTYNSLYSYNNLFKLFLKKWKKLKHKKKLKNSNKIISI